MGKIDLKSIKKMLFIAFAAVLVLSTVSFGVTVNPSLVSAATFTHGGGILYTQADFDRAKQKVALGASPWIEAWNAGKSTTFASPTYVPRPVPAPARWGGHPELNSGGQLFNDSEAALVHAIIWKVSSNTTEANNSKLKAQEIVDAWSSTVNTAVGGDEKQLLAGLTGYRLAAAADILSSDSAWVNAGKFTAAKNMLLNYFLPSLRDYLANHYNKNGNQYPYYYRGNQDTAPMVTIMAIGVLCDDLTIYNEAVNEFKNGNHNGRVTHYLIPSSSDPNLAQSEESGRDQPHTQLGIGMLATMAQISYNQKIGDASFEDLYEYSNRLILKGFEYTAKYNNGGTVPFTPVWTYDWRNEPVISESGRGQMRPVYEMVWNHYHNVKGFADSVTTDPVYHTKARAAAFRPEGIHTDHQPFTTLLYTTGPVVSGETYTLRNPNSGKMLDVANGGTANGTNVQIYQDNGNNAQRFTIIDNGDGTHRILAVQSGKALDVADLGTANGTNVQLWTYLGGANQKWRIVLNADGTYKLIDSNSGKALDVNGNGTANGTNVQIWTDTGGQKWEFIRTGVVSGATYKIKNKDSGKYLDTDVNGGVILAAGTIYDDQKWIVSKHSSGYWTIKNVVTGREYLNTDLDNIMTWNTGGGIYDDALWNIEPISGEFYSFRVNNKVAGREYLYATTANEAKWNTGSTDSSTIWVFEKQ
ncbi:RICIN domain-containing protein [Paenibacillus harenae]|uniref:RICIN domain-containing protein n=1 Tax=Paenibacillus harenae TaxID=306543 RepID=UPI0004295129|nr:RICIN domain-containing protein [Paenibacillus harenae]